MYDMPNHRERRNMAKQMGLLEKRSRLSFPDYCAEIIRSQSAGREIHRKKTEDMLRSVEDQLEQIEAGRPDNVVLSEKQTIANKKKEEILKLVNATGETRSYSEVSADYEIAAWKKRFTQIKKQD